MMNALTTEQRFEQVERQFSVSDRRFDRMEVRMNQRYDIMEDHLERHDRHFIETKESIADLARMTKAEFDRIDERFIKIETRLDSLENRFDSLEKQIIELMRLMKLGFNMT